MINIFVLENGRLVKIKAEEIAAHQPIWVDSIAPSTEERAWVARYFSVDLPQPEHLRDIEASARFYEEHGELHVRSDFLLGTEGDSRSVTVAFVLLNNVLFSIHDEDPPIFARYCGRSHGQTDPIKDSRDLLIDLYGADVEFSADALEQTYSDLGKIGSKVLTATQNDKRASEVLEGIAQAELLNGRVRRNLMDTRRAVSFLMRSKLLSADQIEEARQIMKDIDSLDGHTAFLFDKINFLMNATVGFININQNKIVRLFSVAAVMLLPPTLIASIYGMNFKHMPELEWVYGYPYSLAMMAVSIMFSLWLFERKGWLK